MVADHQGREHQGELKPSIRCRFMARFDPARQRRITSGVRGEADMPRALLNRRDWTLSRLGVLQFAS
jgi:hypothetical protein